MDREKNLAGGEQSIYRLRKRLIHMTKGTKLRVLV